MQPLGRKQRQRGRQLLRLGAMYRCTITHVTTRGLDVSVVVEEEEGGGETLAGCVPLHHLTDNAALAILLLATYKVGRGESTYVLGRVADPVHFRPDPDPANQNF